MALRIKRRRWKVLDSGEIITRDWILVHKGARMITEFGLFLKGYLDNHPISFYHLGHYFQLDGKQLQEQYKEQLSEYGSWDQKGHADDWMLFIRNTSPFLSIDETALSNDELYTIVTNKEAKGRKGAIVAKVKGTA